MKNKGISLITLIITVVVVLILAVAIILIVAKNNPVKQADIAVFKQDVAVMQDVLNNEIADIILENMETPVLYMDETYTQKVTDRVWINKDSDKIGKLYYTTSKEKGCIIFGREGQARINQVTEVATNKSVEIIHKKYRYTEQELPTYKNRKLKWYVTVNNKIVLEAGNVSIDSDGDNEGNGNGIGDSVIDEPGTYRFTVNAGKKADWLSIEIKDLVIPDGASITYSFETSDDKNTWNTVVKNIDEAIDSQYLRVKLTLLANKKGESPSLTSVKVRFKTDVDDITITIEEMEGYKEVYYNGSTMYESENDGAKITQVVDFGENKANENTKIEIPVIKNNKTEYLTNTNTSVDGARVNIYVSNDGVNYKKIDPTIESIAGNRYVKLEVIAQKGVIVGKAEVNANKESTKLEWITTKTEYYEADAISKGEWISIEKEEEIFDGTRIKYTFSKSDDYVNWKEYSKSIVDNGESRYLKVKVEYQKQSEEITKEALLKELVINYKVNGKANKIYSVIQRPEPPIDITYVLSGTTMKIKAVVENEEKIIGVQYKAENGEWSTTYEIGKEYSFSIGEKTTAWVATRAVGKDGKTVSNPIQKTIMLKLEDSCIMIYKGGMLDLPTETRYDVTKSNKNITLSGNRLTSNNDATSKDRITLKASNSLGVYNIEVYVSPELEGDEYVIKTAYDLEVFRIFVNNKNAVTHNARLENDIDLSVVCSASLASWEPIGNLNIPYTGTFKGQNNLIKGLYINSSSDYQALFGYNTGTIKDVSIKGSVVVNGNCVSGICAVSTGMIDNCNNYATVKNSNMCAAGIVSGITGSKAKVANCNNYANINAKDQAGGIIGSVLEGGVVNITSCTNIGSVTTVLNVAGGILGLNFDGKNVIIEKCTNKGKIVAGVWASGGILGDSVTQININMCLNEGEIYSPTGNCGGIVGSMGMDDSGVYTLTIDNSFNTGYVHAEGKSGNPSCGGIVGSVQFSDYAVISNSYNIGKVESTSYTSGNIYHGVGGIVGTVYNNNTVLLTKSKVTVTNTYNVGNISNSYSTSYAGQIIGRDHNKLSKATNSYYLSTASGKNTYGGISKTMLQLKSLAATLGSEYVTDTTNINNGYPILKWQLK